MKKYYYTMFGNRQEVTEEQFAETYRASLTYHKRIAEKAKDDEKHIIDVDAVDPEVPTDWNNGLLSGMIEDVPELNA